MSDGNSNQNDQAARRKRRLAVALRHNLKRRKEQVRGRTGTDSAKDAGDDPMEPHDSAEIGAEKQR